MIEVVAVQTAASSGLGWCSNPKYGLQINYKEKINTLVTENV
jgi:hypothetical protein